MNPNKRITSLLTVVALGLVTGTALRAQTLTDGTFSSPNIGTSYEQANPPASFMAESSFTGTGGVISDQFYTGFSANDPGPGQLLFETPTSTGGTSGVYQSLGALKPHTMYSVTVYVSTGDNDSFARGSSTFELDLYNGTDSSTAAVGTMTLAETENSTSTATYAPETVTYTTGAVVSGNLTLGISAFDASGQNSGQVFFSDATLTSTNVPEPSSWALALLGLGAAALAARRLTGRTS